jgi:hypothetical protein
MGVSPYLVYSISRLMAYRSMPRPATLPRWIGGVSHDLTLYCPVAKLLSAISIQAKELR